MTDADIREHVHSLSNRINVMVAIYNDEDPFMAYSIYPQDHQNDKIAAIYYYPCIHATTPCGADGQYYPSVSWYAAEYHYSPHGTITTTGYQCTAQVQEQTIAEENTAEKHHLITAIQPLPAATHQEPLAVAPTPHSYNCPLKNLPVDVLKQLYYQVFNVMYCHQLVAPGSFAAGNLSSEKPTFCYQPHHSLNPFNHYYYYQSHTTHLTSNHHCRGDTVAQNSPYHYCHSPPSLS